MRGRECSHSESGCRQCCLIKQRTKVSAVRSDVSKLTVGDVLLECLKDPETRRLKSHDGAHQMASWWIQHCGATKVLDTNVVLGRAFDHFRSEAEGDSAAINALYNLADHIHLIANPLLMRCLTVSGLAELVTIEVPPPIRPR